MDSVLSLLFLATVVAVAADDNMAASSATLVVAVPLLLLRLLLLIVRTLPKACKTSFNLRKLTSSRFLEPQPYLCRIYMHLSVCLGDCSM